MKKVVFTVREDVCQQNGKDVNATELLEKMTHYGTVEDYGRAIEAVKAEYQTSIDNLTKQIDLIKEQELTQDEIRMVNSYRQCKENVVSVHQAKEKEYERQLQAIKSENEQRVQKLKEILGV